MKMQHRCMNHLLCMGGAGVRSGDRLAKGRQALAGEVSQRPVPVEVRLLQQKRGLATTPETTPPDH